MKKNPFYLFVCIALGAIVGSCDKSDNKETKAISLSAPADGQSYDLQATAEVSFSWSVKGTVSGGYVLLLSKNADLTAAQTVEAANASVTVPAATLDTKLEALGVAKGASQKLYWSVKPAAASEEVTTPAARVINLKRLPEPPPPPRYDLSLTAPADGASYSSAADAFTQLIFGWTQIDEVEAYTLKIATSEEGLATTTITYEKGNSGGHTISTADDFDDLLRQAGLNWEQTATLWWTVVPTTANDAVDTYTRSFSATRRPQPEIDLNLPADNASVNAYVATFPVTFTWTKIPTVSGYTLKLSPTGDFTTEGAFVAFDAGDNNSYNLDKTTCEGLLATVAAAAGSAYTGKVALQWTVVPTTPAANVTTQVRTLVAIGGESDFPYELNPNRLNADGWTVSASSTNGAFVPGNILTEGSHWESNGTLGALNGAVALTIDMQNVKTVTQINEQIRIAVGNSNIYVKKNEADEWTPVGTLNFDYSNNDKKELILENPVEARYIHIQITTTWNNNADYWVHYLSIHHVWVYGSNNGE
jgi:hypothetical protein